MKLVRLLVIITIIATPWYLTRFLVGPVPIYLPETALLLALVIYLAGWAFGRWRPIWPEPTILWCMGLLLAGSLIATLLSPNTETFGALKSWVILPMIFFWLLNQVTSEHLILTRRWLGWAIVAVTGWIALQGVGGMFFQHLPRLQASFNSPNAAALWLVPLLFVGLFLLGNRSVRLGWGLLMIVAILLTKSLGGLMALVVAGAIVSYCQLKNQQSRFTILPLVAILITAIALFAGLTGSFDRLLSKNSDQSFQSRYEIWFTAWQIGREHPVVGIGPGRFESVYPTRVNRYFVDPIEWSVPQPHNLYLATWLSAGVLGLIGLLGLSGLGLCRAVRSGNYLVVGAFTAILVHGLIDTGYWKNDLAIIFFLILSLVMLAIESSTVPIQRPERFES